MKKIFLTFFFLISIRTFLFSQSVTDSRTADEIKNYYKLALNFKDGKDVAMNYDSAFHYFQKAADLGDAQSIYAVAYMHYKGLGCKQDYDIAASLFYKGAML